MSQSREQPPIEGDGHAVEALPEDGHPIKLSSKTLVHISSGLYRSTANALKELVSNAFDADANVVRINTNYPEFDVLTCTDDGNGMTEKEFKRLMDGGIGDSDKRTGATDEALDSPRTKEGRPIIGRIGIGMLAIAQVCYEFKIVSHHKESKTAFEAVLNLRPYRLLEASADEQKEEYEIGFYKCESISYDARRAGVLISTNDLVPTYIQRYREDVQREKFRKPPKSFAGFIKEVTKKKHKSIRSLGDYWRLFWELSVSCPVAYIEGGPLRRELIEAAVKSDSREEAKQAPEIIKALVAELKGYNFNVVVDGISLRKPVLIPSNEKEKTEGRITPVTHTDKVIGLPLEFRGYIYTQGAAIYPKELRGILIRVKNVAIGGYDSSCLDYESVQGFRFDWVSGEIYVDQGLEEALNVDRYSFNEVHPHYLTLQKEVHRILEKGKVFSEARRASEAKHKLSTRTLTKEGDKEFLKLVRGILEVSYRIHRIEEYAPGDKPLEVQPRKGLLIVHDKHPLWPKRKSERWIAERVLMSFKLAQAHEKSRDDVEERALAILREVFENATKRRTH